MVCDCGSFVIGDVVPTFLLTEISELLVYILEKGYVKTGGGWN
jgi:hypothetical protein